MCSLSGLLFPHSLSKKAYNAMGVVSYFVAALLLPHSLWEKVNNAIGVILYPLPALFWPLSLSKKAYNAIRVIFYLLPALRWPHDSYGMTRMMLFSIENGAREGMVMSRK